MASRGNSAINGITIKINGDTSDLGKAIKDSEEKARSLQTELTAVEKKLKFDPGNTELLAQKQDILKEAIAATSDKLGTLKEYQSEVERQFKNGEIGAEQYRAFKREVMTAESQIESFKSKQTGVKASVDNAFSGIKNVAKDFAKVDTSAQGNIASIQKIGTTIAGVTTQAAKMAATAGKAAASLELKALSLTADGFKSYISGLGQLTDAFGKYAAAVGAATTAATGYAVSVGSSFESQMSTVASISGATAEEWEALTEVAKEMGQTTQFSATEAAQGLEYMAMAGWSTAEMTKGLSGVIDLAAASGEDLAAVSDIVTDAMTAFGMSADQSTRFADVLAKTASSANTDVATMGETFKNVAPLAGAMGYSIEDMSVAIGLMANAGVKGSKAGTSLKNLITNLADPTDEVSEAMQELGVSLTDSEGNTKSFEAVLGELRSSFDGLSEAEKAQYASTIAGKQGMSGFLAMINSSDEDFQSLSEAINDCDGAASEMAEIRLDNLQGDITLLKSNVEGAAIAFYEDLAPGLRDSVQGINELVTAFNEGGVDGLIEKIPEVIGGMLTQLTTSLGTNAPQAISALTSLLTTIINTLAQQTPSLIGAVLPSLLEGFFGLIESLLANAPSLIESFLTGFSEYAPDILAGITALVAQVLTMFAEQAPEIISTVLPVLLEGFFGLVSAIVESVPEILPVLLDGAVTLFMGLLDGLNQVVEELMPMLPELIQDITDTLIDNLPLIIDGGFQLLTGLIEGITDCTPTLIDAVTKLVPKITQGLTDNLPKLVTAGLELIVAVSEGLPQAIPTLVAAIPEIITAIIDAFAEQDWGEIAVNILDGLAGGLLNGIDALIDAVADICEEIWDEFTDFFGIASPSKLMRDTVGKFISQGIAVGISENEDAPVSAAKGVAKNVAGAAASIDPIKLQSSFTTSSAAKISTSSARSSAAPKTAVFNMITDGKTWATVTAPYSDVINGANLKLAARGVTVNV